MIDKMVKGTLMLGNEAVARGAYEAGALVASSYPGTPSTEITEFIAEYDEIYSEWAPNEKVALEVALGAAIMGGRAITAMKHVGLNVAADPLFTASYTGVNAGLVICVADDMGMHSSQNEQDSRHYARASKTMMLEPSDSAECLAFTKKAFELSERFDTPVLIRLSTRVSHSQSLVSLSERTEAGLKEYVKNPGKYVMMPAMARGRHVVVEKRAVEQALFAETSELNVTVKTDNKIDGKRVGVISAGIAYQYAKDALGDSVSYLKLGMVYPMPDKLLSDFVKSVDVCYVIEELDPFIEGHCRTLGLDVRGKSDFSLLGEYTASRIRKVVLGEVLEFAEAEAGLPARPPVMCPGCPHRGVYYAVKRLGLMVSGDIGCYTLGALPPLESIDTCVCMGASVSMAHGMEKVITQANGERKKIVGLIGDSTFMHSGITGLIDIVYNMGTSTIIIVDNSITGMTGHQDNPTTGRTIKGTQTPPVSLEKLCEAVGVRRVRVVDPFDTELMIKTLDEETQADEASVIIARRPCALLKTFVSYGKRTIDANLCKKCGMCQKIGCPAISKTDGFKIDRNQCVGCALCDSMCKFGAIVKAGER